jgi:hypothetical protein
MNGGVDIPCYMCPDSDLSFAKFPNKVQISQDERFPPLFDDLLAPKPQICYYMPDQMVA